MYLSYLGLEESRTEHFIHDLILANDAYHGKRSKIRVIRKLYWRQAAGEYFPPGKKVKIS